MESLGSLSSIYTAHGSFKLQKRRANLLYQILSICQGKGGRGPLGRLYTHCAYNQSSALPEDKKKYILLNNSSLEQQKEPRRENELAWEVGFNGKSGVSIEAPQMLQFGKGLNCAETSLRSLPRPGHLQDVGLQCLVQSILRGNREITEHKGSAPELLREASPFPRPCCGKGLRQVKVQVHGRERKQNPRLTSQAGNQNQGEGKMVKECETLAPHTLNSPHCYSYSILVLKGVGEK